MSKTIGMKNNELVAKQGEMTALKAKLFNEEKLIREKQKKMQKDYEEKIGVLTRQVNQVWPPNSTFFCFLFRETSLICQEGKSMTLCQGNTNLFRSSQQLPRLRLGTLKGFLS